MTSDRTDPASSPSPRPASVPPAATTAGGGLRLPRHFSLRQLLTVPYVLLLALLAAVLGALSYRAGAQAVDALSQQLLSETVYRISQAVERHVAGSAAVLESAFPQGVPAPEAIDAQDMALRTRFWLASSVHRDPNNYVYYGNRAGHFYGLWRHDAERAELRLRTRGEGPRTLWQFEGLGGTLHSPQVQSRPYDPRERPWYRAGQDSATPNHFWTAIYIDFTLDELVITRARRVDDAQGRFAGVVATDMSLRKITQFLASLKLSQNGFAYVVETDGKLVATSRGTPMRRGAEGRNQRLNAGDSDDPQVAASYRELRALFGQAGQPSAGDAAPMPQAQTRRFTGADGQTIQAAYARLRDGAGLDWIIVVGVPRSDFLGGIEANVRNTVLLGVAAVLAAIVLGLGIVGLVTRDLERLARAARRVGEGELEAPVSVMRTDEMGQLARSFADMRHQLMTDRLTGVPNRAAVLRRLEARVAREPGSPLRPPFALLFVDLNRFKQINDRYGHDAGDAALVELAGRMTRRLRGDDMVARYAGDEFLVLLEGVAERADAEKVAHDLGLILAEPLTSIESTRPISAGAAIGLAMYPEDGLDVDTLIKVADTMMYADKQRTR
jgi:diguanylate cyclase (GGDEF)-like protein